MSTLPLKKLVDPSALKDEFVTQTGSTKEIKAPRRKGFKLSADEQDYVKVMVFGPVGSGKTYLLGQLVELGLKVAAITTDLGDTGHLTVKTQLVRAGRKDLLDNYYVIPLDGWAEVTNFLRNPWKYDPDLLAFNPDVLAWDGFSYFQQIDISEYVGDMNPAEKSNGQQRDRGDFRESGLVMEQSDWGAIRNATIRKAETYLSLRNPNGKALHKFMTCAEAIKYKPKNSERPNEGQIAVEAYEPLLSGAGGKMLLGGFDLIMRSKRVVKKGDDGEVPTFTYVTSGNQNLVAKNRGFDLLPEEPANMHHIWDKIQEGLGKGLAAVVEE